MACVPLYLSLVAFIVTELALGETCLSTPASPGFDICVDRAPIAGLEADFTARELS